MTGTDLELWKRVERIDEGMGWMKEAIQNLIKSFKIQNDKYDTLIKCQNDKYDILIHEINGLKINQETIQANSCIEDEKIKGMVNLNSAKTAGITTMVLMILQYLLSHFK